ncbi:MAG: cell division protein FtsZ, partial [Spiribacter salinus]
EAGGEHRAREAAERAIACPLLEDVNIAGAHGILVNVTAGLDLSIGEFDEVGNAVKEFASEDATVVVGTVIDPELEGELRVTVVATGLAATKTEAEPVAAPRLVTRTANGEVDYDALERPAVARKRAAAGGGASESEGDMEYLDIPAFLRRQAD